MAKLHNENNFTIQGNLEKLLQKNREEFLPPDTKHLKVKFLVTAFIKKALM